MRTRLDGREFGHEDSDCFRLLGKDDQNNRGTVRRLSFRQKLRSLRIGHRRLRQRRLRALSKVEREIVVREALQERLAFARAHNIPVDRELGRRQIVLPEIFSLANNFDATVGAVAELRTCVMGNRQRAMLFFEHVREIEPAAALLLAAELFRCRRLHMGLSGFASGTYPQSPEVYRQMEEMGFFKLLKIAATEQPLAATTNRGAPIFLQFITGDRFSAELIDRLVTVIEKRVVPLDAAARQRLVGSIKEAMGNICEHAYRRDGQSVGTGGRWWLSAAVNIERHEVDVIIVDQGVGIPKSLPRRLGEAWRALLPGGHDGAPADSYIIQAATVLGRSSTGERNRGRGFNDMKTFINRCGDGELRVISNFGTYRYMPNQESRSDGNASIGGTLIHWRFQSDGMVSISDD